MIRCPMCKTNIMKNYMINTQYAYCHNCGKIVKIGENREDTIIQSEEQIRHKLPDKMSKNNNFSIIEKILNYMLVPTDKFREQMNASKTISIIKVIKIISDLLRNEEQTILHEKIQRLKRQGLLTDSDSQIIEKWIKNKE